MRVSENARACLGQGGVYMAGRISDPSARMASKMDRSKQRKRESERLAGLSWVHVTDLAKSREVRNATYTI